MLFFLLPIAFLVRQIFLTEIPPCLAFHLQKE